LKVLIGTDPGPGNGPCFGFGAFADSYWYRRYMIHAPLPLSVTLSLSINFSLSLSLSVCNFFGAQAPLESVCLLCLSLSLSTVSVWEQRQTQETDSSREHVCQVLVGLFYL